MYAILAGMSIPADDNVYLSVTRVDTYDLTLANKKGLGFLLESEALKKWCHQESN